MTLYPHDFRSPLTLEDDEDMPTPPTTPGPLDPDFVLEVELPVRLVVSTRREFKRKIISHVDNSGVRRFVCDCSGLIEIDGSGWGALKRVSDYVRDAGGSFRLTNLPLDMRRNLAAYSPAMGLEFLPDDMPIGGGR